MIARPRHRCETLDSCFFLIWLVFAQRAGMDAAPIAADRVRLALPAKSMGYLPLFVAIHRGFFKDESIDIEIADDAAATGAQCAFVRRGRLSRRRRLGAAPGRQGRAAQGDLFRRHAAQLFFDGQTAGQIGLQNCAANISAWCASATRSSWRRRIALSREGLDLQRDAVPIMIGLPTHARRRSHRRFRRRHHRRAAG